MASEQSILKYFEQHADRIITLDELEHHYAGDERYKRELISAAVNRVLTKFPTQSERCGSGCYRWLSQPRSSGTELPSEMLIKVLATKDDGFLIQDTETSAFFVMRPLKW